MNKFITALILCLLTISCSKDIETIDTTGTVFGLVSDLETGDPISKVSVTLYEGLAWDCLGAVVGVTFTGTDGFFQITDIDPSKSYFIVFRHAGYNNGGLRVRVEAGKSIEINYAMSKE